ncbi:MAG: carbamoyltransferase C-terminal domain-containing protein [Candidatus Alcyoniella australis]|nr:carbamoyltransferase C-terminal domain-containing protein [Candidatus Alcyoniella australis]
MSGRLVYSDTRDGRMWRVKLPLVEHRVLDDPTAQVAKLLADDKIVGWFYGASEFGPRALGQRSILADPRSTTVVARLNEQIKHRQWFRPYAPAVLADQVSRYFELDAPSPHMLLVAPVREQWRERLPAITHVDGTARIQTVTREDNAPLFALLTQFEKLSGVGVLLNTSFNDHGEPIVESPADALAEFLAVELDALVIQDVLVTKHRAEQR